MFFADFLTPVIVVAWLIPLVGRLGRRLRRNGGERG
jgi:hypothetical protein